MKFLNWILDFFRRLFGASTSSSKEIEPPSVGGSVDMDAVLPGRGPGASPTSGPGADSSLQGRQPGPRVGEPYSYSDVLRALPVPGSTGSPTSPGGSTFAVNNPDFILVPGENGDELRTPTDFEIKDGWIRSPYVSTKKRTPNTSSRLGAKVDWITLHYIAGVNASGAANWLCNPQAKASAHFVMDQKGYIMQLAPLDVRTWHVGRGEFFTNGELLKTRCDRSAIGIELANPGPVVWDKDEGRFEYFVGRIDKHYDHKKYGDPKGATLRFEDGTKDEAMWAPYQKEMIAWLAWLCANLVQEYDIPVNRIVGHESAARPLGRKTDPGPLFPWLPFYEIVCAYLDIKLPNDLDKYHKVIWR